MQFVCCSPVTTIPSEREGLGRQNEETEQIRGIHILETLVCVPSPELALVDTLLEENQHLRVDIAQPRQQVEDMNLTDLVYKDLLAETRTFIFTKGLYV